MSEPSDNPAPEAPPPPSYFMAMEVENLRCFGSRQRLDLSDGRGNFAPWTLILGDNGTGKTTLLQYLALTRPDLDKHIGDFVPSHLLLTRYLDTLLSLKTDDLESGQIIISFENKSICLEFVEEDTYGFTILLPQEILWIPTFAYGATRRMSESQISLEDLKDPVATLFDADARLINPEEWLLRLDYQALHEGRRGAAQQRLEQVKELIVHILPDVKDIQIGPPTASAGGREMVSGIRFVLDQGPVVPLKGLGLGYQTMMAWVVDLASRMLEQYPDSPDPLGEPAVVLIDEIDLHLHPRWQRQIFKFLSDRFPRVQFIATAHSPLVVQAGMAIRANLAVLRWKEGEIVIENDPKVVEGWRVDQILTSDLFGIESARAPHISALISERRALLNQASRSPEEQLRLEELDRQVSQLPSAERPEDQEAMDLIREAAELLKGAKRS